MIRNNNQNRRRRGGNNNNGPRPQQMGAGNNYGNRLDNRQRGNASQLLEKYRALARDAQQAGDRVTAEYYLQYADHYYRVLGDYRDKQPEQGRQRGQFYDDDSSGYAANGDDSDEGGDDDQDSDRVEARGDARNDDRDDQRSEDNRGNWREERANQGGGSQNGGQGGGQNGNQPRERNFRDSNRDGGQREGNRDNSQRDGGRDSGREQAQREQVQREPRREADSGREPRRDGDLNREPRREGDVGRDRQNWNGSNAGRNGTGERELRRERPERRPEPARAEPVSVDEGPIPGLPGPATLRAAQPSENRAEPRTERAPRAPRREAAIVEPVLFEAPPQAVPETAPTVEAADSAEVVTPRRRGRPRKVVVEAAAEE